MSRIASSILNFINPAGVFTRYIPQPRSSTGQSFMSVLGGVASSAASAVGIGPMQSEYAQLINRQIEVQQQMQVVSMVSNVEKSRHETQMAAVRNIRAG